MALLNKRSFKSAILNLKIEDDNDIVFSENHIFEPEYHQEIYYGAEEEIKRKTGSFQLGDPARLKRQIKRGAQPIYADKDDDPSSLYFEGMTNDSGEIVNDKDGDTNVCALKSICIRQGYIDIFTARSVSREYYQKYMNRSAVQKNDILINSTGDGTIGRVAVYNYDFPAVVDGHITIVRYNDTALAWYVAAFLASENGQRQIYRYINGSSGQVEIYPQDLERIWIPKVSDERIKQISSSYQQATKEYDNFRSNLNRALMLANNV